MVTEWSHAVSHSLDSATLGVWAGLGDALGVGAAAAAVLGLVIGAGRWLMNWRARRNLGAMAATLLDEDDRLTNVASAIDHAFWQGVGWSGWDIWPDSLRPHLATLTTMVDEFDECIARARAVTGYGGTERLRSSIERLATVLRRAAVLYRQGTIQTYQATNGDPLPPGAAARDPTPALRDEDRRAEVEALRDEASLHFRTAAYQARTKLDVERCASWPIVRYETRDPRGPPGDRAN